MPTDKKNPQPVQVSNLIIRIAVMVLLSGLMGVVAYFVVREIVLAGDIGYQAGNRSFFSPNLVTATATPPVVAEATATADLAQTELPALVNTPAAEATLTPWDGKERVTVLIMGVDYRDWEGGVKAPRTDTMMLLTMDPVSKTAGLLSVPRDLWVAIPGFTHGKINTAHSLGELYNLPGGGPALAVRTVEFAIGVPIHYYAVVDFGAFVRFIDEIGGLKLNVPYRIWIDPLNGENVLLRPGVQTIPGDWALAYARNRSKGDGDFDRARRQQQVILAIRDRILEFDLLPQLIVKGPALYRELVGGIQTNMKIDEVIKLALKAQQIPEENIRQGVIDTRYVAFGWSPDKLSILIPYPDQIRLLRDEIFSTSGTLGPLTPGSLTDKVALEAASVSIQNASNTADLGTRTAEFLTKKGIIVTEVVEVGAKMAQTRVVDHAGRPFTMAYLTDLFQLTKRNIEYEYAPGKGYHLTITLGNDWAADPSWVE